MLTRLLDLLPTWLRHWLFRAVGVQPAAVHLWCPSVCPCDEEVTA